MWIASRRARGSTTAGRWSAAGARAWPSPHRAPAVDVERAGVAVSALRRAPVAGPAVGDDPVSLGEEEHHLVVPVVAGERPAVAEDDRLPGAPVLVEDVDSVIGGHVWHWSRSLRSGTLDARAPAPDQK